MWERTTDVITNGVTNDITNGVEHCLYRIISTSFSLSWRKIMDESVTMDKWRGLCLNVDCFVMRSLIYKRGLYVGHAFKRLCKIYLYTSISHWTHLLDIY